MSFNSAFRSFLLIHCALLLCPGCNLNTTRLDAGWGEFLCDCGHQTGYGFGFCLNFIGTWDCDFPNHCHFFPEHKICGRWNHASIVKVQYLGVLETLSNLLHRTYKNALDQKIPLGRFYDEFKAYLREKTLKFK